MRKILLFLLFSLSLFPKFGFKMSLITPFSAMAQTSSSELFECEDDLYGPYESSFPCEATPCVTVCETCSLSHPCDEPCPALYFCSTCHGFHHLADCPGKTDDDDDDDDDSNNNTGEDGSGGGTGTGGGAGGGSNSGTGNGSGITPKPIVPKKSDGTITGLPALKRYHDWHSNCKEVADALLRDVYGKDPGSCSSVYQVAVENNNGDKSDYLTINFAIYKMAQVCIEKIIDNGGVVIAGVDHSSNTAINEGTTDHFIVITGYEIEADGSKYYRYLETGTDKLKTQQSRYNRLYCNDYSGKIAGIPSLHKDRVYTITQVRPNDGGYWPGTTNACPN